MKAFCVKHSRVENGINNEIRYIVLSLLFVLVRLPDKLLEVLPCTCQCFLFLFLIFVNTTIMQLICSAILLFQVFLNGIAHKKSNFLMLVNPKEVLLNLFGFLI